VTHPAPEGWSSTEQHSPDGAVRLEQRARPPRPVVALSEEGALTLAERYWQEVEASTRRLVRARRRGDDIELLLLGRWTLLRFGAPRTMVDESSTLSRFPIIGGLLARAPGGSITFAQATDPALELRATVDGFLPRLEGRPGRPAWTGVPYRHVQRRLHARVSRRYFLRLIGHASR
jgi:hypothetical protein